MKKLALVAILGVALLGATAANGAWISLVNLGANNLTAINANHSETKSFQAYLNTNASFTDTTIINTGVAAAAGDDMYKTDIAAGNIKSVESDDKILNDVVIVDANCGCNASSSDEAIDVTNGEYSNDALAEINTNSNKDTLLQTANNLNVADTSTRVLNTGSAMLSGGDMYENKASGGLVDTTRNRSFRGNTVLFVSGVNGNNVVLGL